MQACQQKSLLSSATANVHHFVEEVCLALTPLKRLGDEFIVIRQMRSAVDAAVPPVTFVRNKILELSFAHGNRLAAKIHQQFCTV